MITRRTPGKLPSLLIGSAQPQDTRAAALHSEQVEDLLATLGQRLLRAYHERFRSSPYAVAFVAGAAGQPVGRLVAIPRPG